MYQIRSGVFETNSSSTHSIVISKAPAKNFPKHITFHAGEYGWENAIVDSNGDYLFTAILDGNPTKLYDRLHRLCERLTFLGIEAKFYFPPYRFCHGYGCFEDCYIDHGYECDQFIEAVLTDADLLSRFLFGDSCIYTGNDNQDPDPAGCDIGCATYFQYDDDDCFDGKEVPNPFHDEEHYQYFMKGN